MLACIYLARITLVSAVASPDLLVVAIIHWPRIRYCLTRTPFETITPPEPVVLTA